MGIQGIIRGKPHKTTIRDKKAPCPLDTVNRQFRVPAPNMLWVSDFTYVATWKGFVYVAFVIDAYARRIVGWRVSKSPHAGFVLDAIEQAVHERRPTKGMGLVHHSDRGSQYLSIKYTERLAEAGIESSVGSVGDSYDNALAETINGLFKAEVKVLTKEPGTENGVVGAPPSHSTWTSTRAQVLAENVRINVTRHCPPPRHDMAEMCRRPQISHGRANAIALTIEHGGKTVKVWSAWPSPQMPQHLRCRDVDIRHVRLRL